MTQKRRKCFNLYENRLFFCPLSIELPIVNTSWDSLFFVDGKLREQSSVIEFLKNESKEGMRYRWKKEYHKYLLQFKRK